MAREYKDSGIEWIGQIPKEWELPRLKNVAELHGRIGWNGLRSDEFEENSYAYLVTGQDFKTSEIVWNNCYQIRKERYEEDPFIQLHNGEILVTKDGTIGKIAIVSKMDKPGCLNSGIFVLRQKIDAFAPKYLYWQLYSTLLKTYNDYMNLGGTTIIHLYQNVFERMPLISPPLPVQQKIADYLDKVCGEVDEMVALQETMIEELKAYKQSVITEAVTKGLNPNVPMRDSGIDWIGAIPEHWKLEPLKYCFGRRSEKNNPVKTEERLSLSIDKGVTLYSEKTTNLDRFKEDFTQYQLAYPNDIVLNCMNMIVGAVGLSNYMGCVSPVYYVIYPIRQDINPLYYSYLLNIPTIRGVYYSLGKGIYAIERGEGRVNTCRLKVAYNDFGRLDIPVPPLAEQKEINRFIQQKCSEIESLIVLKQAKIEELKEYKKSVIYEYVTGKKEVV